MLPRFSRKRPDYRCRAALVAVMFGLIACSLPQPEPQVTPIPYFFQITGFEDARPPVQDISQINTRFNQERFLRQLQGEMQYSLFGGKPGKLHMKLKSYEITSFKTDYTLSMVMHMKATSDLNKTLVDEDFSCVVDHHGNIIDYVDMVKEVKDNPSIVSKAGWSRKVEQRMVTGCVKELVANFSYAVVRGTPSQGE